MHAAIATTTSDRGICQRDAADRRSWDLRGRARAGPGMLGPAWAGPDWSGQACPVRSGLEPASVTEHRTGLQTQLGPREPTDLDRRDRPRTGGPRPGESPVVVAAATDRGACILGPGPRCNTEFD